MRIALLDVNVLLALIQEGHVFHSRAEEWFQRYRGQGWATCVITEAGLVRIGTQFGFPTESSLGVLSVWSATAEHQFWPLDTSLTQLRPEIRARLQGIQQVTDAILLDLTIRKGGRLVTFDQKLRNLLPPDSPHQGAIEVISA